HAACGYHRAATDHHVRQDDGPRPHECVPLDLHALEFPEVSDDHDAHAEGYAILDGDELRMGRIKDHIVADPHALADADAPHAVERDAKGLRAGKDPGQQLQDAVGEATEHRLAHGGTRSYRIA